MFPNVIFDFIHLHALMIGAGIFSVFGFQSATMFQTVYNYIKNAGEGFRFGGGMTFPGGLAGGAACFLTGYAVYRKRYTAKLFFVMLKIGLFTFGGGYAMIALLENEFVSKRRWMQTDEFADMVAIAESTPGPIAINAATYIGYQQNGILGSAVATLGVCIPSFVIIFLISLFFDAFQQIQWVAAAFRGIQIGVVVLILSAGLKMLHQMRKTIYNAVCISLTAACFIICSLFAVNFSSVFYILIGAMIGLGAYFVKQLCEHRKTEAGK